MCFSPQRRAIFEHLHFKKCSEPLSFLAFSLQNVLLATAACNFWTSPLQKVLRTPQFFSIFTSKCASRHSGVQFLISPLTTWLRTRRFNEPTSPDTRIIWKTQRFATSLTFGAGVSSFFWLSRYCIFFLLTLLSSDFTSSICCSSAFQLSILSEVYYLNFLRSYHIFTDNVNISHIYIYILYYIIIFIYTLLSTQPPSSHFLDSTFSEAISTMPSSAAFVVPRA